MKTKETTASKLQSLEKLAPTKAKQKSLRPMRSMVALRSFKPRTAVAELVARPQEKNEVRT
jgi:hypothetical protein